MSGSVTGSHYKEICGLGLSVIEAPPTSPPYVDSNRGEIFLHVSVQYAVGNDGPRVREQG